MSVPRNFETSEYEARLRKAQTAMAKHGLGALLLTQEADLRYFSGFLTRFWESPTRPWFLVIPANGKPIAVIPSIGAALMGQTWVDDIRTWTAPNPDDDGVSLLIDTLREIGGPVALPSNLESHMRMPRATYEALRTAFQSDLTNDRNTVADLRAVKSEAEIDKLREACAIAGRAFARVPEIAQSGALLSDVFRKFQILCLEEGADWVPYVAGGAGQGGYSDVISPASDVPLLPQDVLMLDTGVMWDGYFSDFDRNFSVMKPGLNVKIAYSKLIDATLAGRHAAKVGAQACDVYAAMREVLSIETEAGRLGHGVGMQLTEGLSVIPADQTELRSGMVITLEPGIPTRDGRLMVHEEVIVIRDEGAEALSPFADHDMPVLT